MSKNISAEKIILTEKDVDAFIDGITLLSVDEYEKVRDYIKPIDSHWWLRSPGISCYFVVIVLNNCDIDDIGLGVDFESSIRPVLKLKSSDFQIGDSFQFGGYTWAVISNDYALCDTTFCKMSFKKDWRAQGANDYEKSDIKKFLDKWYTEQIKSYSDAAVIVESKPVCEDAISRADSIEHISRIIKSGLSNQAKFSRIMQYIKKCPSVELKIYGNEHDCIMTLFGECSYSETGCGDCAVVEKVRDALKDEYPPIEPKLPKGEWVRATNPIGETIVVCSHCGKIRQQGYDDFCGACGTDMRGDKDV